MRFSTILALVVALIFAHKAQSDSCFEPFGNNLIIAKGCTVGKTTVWSGDDEFIVDFFGETGKLDSKGSLTLGGCSMKIGFGELLGDSILKVDGNPFSLPTIATAKKGSVSFSRRDKSSYSVPCTPTFKQADGGNVMDVEYSMSPAVDNLTIRFNSSRIDSKVADELGLKVIIIICVSVFAFLLSLSSGIGFFILRWWKKQANRAKEKAAKKVEPKKVEPKKVEPKEVEPKKVEPKKEAAKENPEAKKPESVEEKEAKEGESKIVKSKEVGTAKSKEVEQVCEAKSKEQADRSKVKKSSPPEEVKPAKVRTPTEEGACNCQEEVFDPPKKTAKRPIYSRNTIGREDWPRTDFYGRKATRTDTPSDHLWPSAQLSPPKTKQSASTEVDFCPACFHAPKLGRHPTELKKI